MLSSLGDGRGGGSNLLLLPQRLPDGWIYVPKVRPSGV